MATYYTGRRTLSSSNSATWTPNRNAVRHESQIRLGPVWRGVILASIVVLIGLFTVSQSAKITAYDVEIAGVDDEIASLEAQRDVPQDGCTSHGDETDLVVTIVVRVAAAGVDGAIDPPALGDVGVEQVVGFYP